MSYITTKNYNELTSVLSADVACYHFNFNTFQSTFTLKIFSQIKQQQSVEENRDSSVGKVTKQRLDNREMRLESWQGVRDFSVIQIVQTGAGDHQASYSTEIGGCPPTVKATVVSTPLCQVTSHVKKPNHPLPPLAPHAIAWWKQWPRQHSARLNLTSNCYNFET